MFLCHLQHLFYIIPQNKPIAKNKDKTNYSCVYFDIFGESYDTFIEKVKNIKEHKNISYEE